MNTNKIEIVCNSVHMSNTVRDFVTPDLVPLKCLRLQTWSGEGIVDKISFV
jgi:hypothetical protein